jgi:hypothetical protein
MNRRRWSSCAAPFTAKQWNQNLEKPISFFHILFSEKIFQENPIQFKFNLHKIKIWKIQSASSISEQICKTNQSNFNLQKIKINIFFQIYEQIKTSKEELPMLWRKSEAIQTDSVTKGLWKLQDADGASDKMVVEGRWVVMWVDERGSKLSRWQESGGGWRTAAHGGHWEAEVIEGRSHENGSWMGVG